MNKIEGFAVLVVINKFSLSMNCDPLYQIKKDWKLSL